VKRIHIIINPSSGQAVPILHTLNNVFSRYAVKWSISITEKGNISEIINNLNFDDIDILAVYGGDGTISEVVNALDGRDVLLGILPGGTANILSIELGIPQDLKKACRILCQRSSREKQLDLGKFNGRYFILRLGLGFEAEIVKSAGRSFKNNFGWLAYALSGPKALLTTKPTCYQMVIDGRKVQCQGVSLLIMNSANLGLPLFTFSFKTKMDDGVLDVFLIRRTDLQRLFRMEKKDLTGRDIGLFFRHWQAKEVSVRARPKQILQCDGELLEIDKFDVQVVPKAIRVVVKDK
jgi:diacylglycerol kinase (ATP)